MMLQKAGMTKRKRITMHGVTNMIRCHSEAETGIVAVSNLTELDMLMGYK